MDIKETSKGVILSIKVIAPSKKTEISIKDNHLVIRVNAVKEKGKANTKVIEALSDFFKLPKSFFEIIQGEKSSFKQLLIKNVTNKDVIEQTLLKHLKTQAKTPAECDNSFETE